MTCDLGELDNNPAVFRNNNFFSSNLETMYDGCATRTGTDSNISADPRFVNPAVGNYRLSPDSPSIDRGDNSAPNLPPTDSDGNQRIQDGDGDGIAVADMGAYEVSHFDHCINDDSNGNILKVNSATGDYELTNCSGLTLRGIGILSKRGTILTLQHNAADRRLSARIDLSTNKGTASIQIFSQGITLTLTDRVSGRGTCSCGSQ